MTTDDGSTLRPGFRLDWTTVRRIDGRVLAAVVAPRDSPGIPVWRTVTELGSRRAVYTGVGLLVLAAGRQGRWTVRAVAARAARPAVAVIGADLSHVLLKRLVARPRPPRQGWLVRPHGTSFPSRHTTLIASATTIASGGTSAPALRWGLCGVTGLVAVSRLRLGVHWPSDVAAGWALGAGWAVLSGAGRRVRADGTASNA